jgi:hypothetical protein
MFNSITHPYDLREIAMSGGGGAIPGQTITKTPH